jgi:hypothetical protein
VFERDGDDFLVNLFIRLMGLLFVGGFVFTSLKGVREAFVVSAPLLMVFIPGYLSSIEVTHGRKCDCFEPDSACEIGFWCQLGAKFFLVLALLWISIYLYYLIDAGVGPAATATVNAILVSAAYFFVYFLVVHAVVYIKRR